MAERRADSHGDLANPEAVREHTGHNEPLAAIIEEMEARSAIVQPLIARGETIGAMFFVVGPDRTYGQADVEITGELARRVAVAIANGQIRAAEQ